MQQEPEHGRPDYGNYGRHPEPGDDYYGGGGPREMMQGGSSMSPRDENTWSLLSHLSVLVWAFTAFLPIASLVMWLVFRDRSPKVAFHALQSMWYQIAWFVVFFIGGILGTLLTIVTFGIGAFIVVPVGIVAWLIPVAHSCYAAYRVSQGEDYRYPFIADRIDGGRR